LESLLKQILHTTEEDLEADLFEAVKEALRIGDGPKATCLPSGESPQCDDALGMALYRKVQAESGKIRAALQGVVQAHRRNLPILKCSGNRIDGRRLYRLSLGDGRVFVRQAWKPSPHTAVHVLIDRSESMGLSVQDRDGKSMGTRMSLALDAAMALALAFEGIPGVNPGITAFPGRDERSVYSVLRHGQKLRPQVGAFALRPAGSTPMAEGIWYAAAALLMCREPRKVLMVLTDEQPDDRLSTLEILQRCQHSGIEAVGVGLGIEVSQLFPKAIRIHEFRELRSRLFSLAKDLLISA
jgi:cobalamin biosynthesis protein CobT